MIAMKKVFTILAALFVSANTSVQAQEWHWAKSGKGSSYDVGASICSDANGNTYVTGSFSSSTFTFGSTTLTNADITGNTGDAFIVKYTPNGNVLWAKSIGGISNDIGTKICIDISGNVYITGNFESSTIVVDTIVLTNPNYRAAFIVKYTPDGNVLWAKSNFGLNFISAESVCTDTNSNVYVTGEYSGISINFESTILNNADTTGYSVDIYIMKYDPDGNFMWAKSFGGLNSDYSTNINNDSQGNIFVTGYFKSSAITFDTTTLLNSDISENYFDIFIVKYNPEGVLLWANSAGGAKDDNSYSISTDSIGNAYITGNFRSNSATFGTTILTNADNTGNTSDIFIAKYTSDGNILWANSAGSILNELCTSICSDTSGNFYITGNFKSNSVTFGTTTLINEGAVDIFIVKYNLDGDVIWAISKGNSNEDFGREIYADNEDNVFVTGGFYSPTITFGTTTLTNGSNSGNTGDMFIAKYSGVSTGLNEAFTNNQLKISPNPTNSSITLTMPSLKNSTVSITTLTGTEVGTYTTQNTSTQTIDISHLASGVYFVSLKSEEGMVTKKIIKKD
jgi:hypothetical protein